MADLEQYLGALKENGYRLTPARSSIISLINQSKKPLSSPTIQTGLIKLKIKVNKSTVYRELTFLKEQDIVQELQLGDNKKYYEIKSDSHHHHAICVSCDNIQDIILDKDLAKQEQVIAKTNKFKILNHSLEFYGLCQNCQ